MCFLQCEFEECYPHRPPPSVFPCTKKTIRNKAAHGKQRSGLKMARENKKTNPPHLQPRAQCCVSVFMMMILSFSCRQRCLCSALPAVGRKLTLNPSIRTRKSSETLLSVCFIIHLRLFATIIAALKNRTKWNKY